MADKQKEVTYTGVAATAAAIMAALAYAKKASVGTVIPPELMELLAALARDTNEIDIIRLPDILAALQGLTIQGFPHNADFPSTGTILLDVALISKKMPDVSIPDGFSIIIKSYPTNPVGGLIQVAQSAGEAANSVSSWPLVPNEFIGYQVQNANSIWVAATVVPSIVVWTVEQRR